MAEIRDPDTGAKVDIPMSFSLKMQDRQRALAADVSSTRDHRAHLTLQSVPNPKNDSPATFLEAAPPAGIQYKRITHVSLRCLALQSANLEQPLQQVNKYMNRVLINYPAAEERDWDAVVTRISLSLGN